ncbi:MAG TPA: HEPN domain-containing protein, partial [Pedobacter sp.]
SCFTNHKTENTCNYCLLLVTESPTRIDHEAQEFCNCHYHHGNITIICHGQESITEAIKANNRFFSTVCNTGQLIYSHDGISNFDADHQFTPTQSAVKARKHLSHHMPLAEGFLSGAGECLSKEQFNVCVFMLHQVIEQCLITLIRVHLAYRSEIHNLKRMLGLCQAFSDEPTKMLLSGNPQDKKLFDVLTKSYSSARYTSTFSVNKEDAKELYKRVSAFFTLTHTMCKEKIKQLDIEASNYQELHCEQKIDHQIAGILI